MATDTVQQLWNLPEGNVTRMFCTSTTHPEFSYPSFHLKQKVFPREEPGDGMGSAQVSSLPGSVPRCSRVSGSLLVPLWDPQLSCISLLAPSSASSTCTFPATPLNQGITQGHAPCLLVEWHSFPRSLKPMPLVHLFLPRRLVSVVLMTAAQGP